MGLARRLALWFAALVVVAAVATSVAALISTENALTDETDEFLRERADDFTDGRRSGPRGVIPRPGERRATDIDAEVQLLSSDGDVLGSAGLELPVEDVDRSVAATDSREVLRTVDVDGADYRMITSPLRGGGAVQVARSLAETESILADIRRSQLLIGLSMALIAACAGWLIARRTTRPLRSLTDAVDRVAATGDVTVPVDAGGDGEVGRLATGFNRMLAALDTSRAQQRRLVEDAAHELRTPLTSIRANVDLLDRAPSLDPDERAASLRSVKGELAELTSLVDEIVELASGRFAEGEFVEVDLGEVARSALDQFVQRTRRTVEASIDAGIVRGDHVALGRAMANLLSNADKYSPVDSPIALVVSGGRVSVADHGIGIDPEDRERVFDRFHRGVDARAEPGSGLGLSIVADIVRSHGGSVFVEDGPDGGAIVGFSLPNLPAPDLR